MEFSPATTPSVICFVLILVAVVAAIVGGTYLANPKRMVLVAVGAMVWLFVLSVVVKSGFLAESPMPRVMIFFGFINLVSIGFALSPLGRWLSTGVPLNLLVCFQVFRLPLELVLHDWARQGTIPWAMTWSGANFDIVSGVAAIVLAPFVGRVRAAAWLANGIGLILLLNVMRVAVLSSPLPFAWKVNPPLLLVFYLPYALIVPVCVGGALFGHVVLTRALLTKSGVPSSGNGKSV